MGGLKVVSLFAGCGGLDLGFEWAGHECVWANDNWEEAGETYRENFDSPIEIKDVTNVNSEEVPEANIIMGGWPCQGFTIANIDREVDDERNKLYKEMLRIVKAKEPEFILAENVPGILSMADGKVVELIVDDFEQAGYNIKYRKFNTANYGVPQKRKRVIWVGVRKDLDVDIQWPKPTHRPPREEANLKRWVVDESQEDKPPWLTLEDAIGDMPEPEDEHGLENHYGSNHKVKVNGHLGNRKLEWDDPSPTITGRGEGGGGPVIHPHPNLNRRLTVRECARIQTFPDDFLFRGSMTSEYGQIGNAVPPVFAEKLAEQFPNEI